MAELAGRKCWMCGGLVAYQRPLMVQVWEYDALFRHEWVCDSCWQDVAVSGSVRLERGGKTYVVRCVARRSAAVSSPDGAAGSSP